LPDDLFSCDIWVRSIRLIKIFYHVSEAQE
jgi:hypothetical protein